MRDPEFHIWWGATKAFYLVLVGVPSGEYEDTPLWQLDLYLQAYRMRERREDTRTALILSRIDGIVGGGGKQDYTLDPIDWLNPEQQREENEMGIREAMKEMAMNSGDLSMVPAWALSGDKHTPPKS